jgi:hypothetical protein
MISVSDNAEVTQWNLRSTDEAVFNTVYKKTWPKMVGEKSKIKISSEIDFHNDIIPRN